MLSKATAKPAGTHPTAKKACRVNNPILLPGNGYNLYVSNSLDAVRIETASTISSSKAKHFAVRPMVSKPSHATKKHRRKHIHCKFAVADAIKKQAVQHLDEPA